MLKSQILINVAERCEKRHLENDLTIFRAAFDAVYGAKPERVLGGSKELTDWLNKYNPYFKLCDAGGYTDAAMMLGEDIPWLVPVMDYSERTVRLVNGVGLPVGGDDHLSRAETMPLALAASWLKAQAKKAAYEELKRLGLPLPDRWTKETPTEEHTEDLRGLDYDTVIEKAKELCRGACFTAFFKHDRGSESEWSLQFHGPSMRELSGNMTPFTKIIAWVNEEVYNQIKSDHDNFKFYGITMTSA